MTGLYTRAIMVFCDVPGCRCSKPVIDLVGALGVPTGKVLWEGDFHLNPTQEERWIQYVALKREARFREIPYKRERGVAEVGRREATAEELAE